MKTNRNLKKFNLNDWLSVGAAITAVVCLICYGITEVGEFNAATVILLALGMLFSIISISIKLPYADLAAFVFYTVAFFLFLESKVFYISAVFVGIDYKGFDASFIFNVIFGLINIILSVASSLPLAKEKNKIETEKGDLANEKS